MYIESEFNGFDSVDRKVLASETTYEKCLRICRRLQSLQDRILFYPIGVQPLRATELGK